MSKQTSRRDPLGEQVANMPLARELEDALFASMSDPDVHLLLDLLPELDADCPREHVLRSIETRLSRVRENPAFRDRLAAYLTDGPLAPHRQGHCRGCGRELESVEERKVGRPREHCSNICRQLAYRNRQRAARQRRLYELRAYAARSRRRTT